MHNFVFDLYGTLVDISTNENSQKFWDRFTAYSAKTYGAGGGIRREFEDILAGYTGYREPDICEVLRLAVQKSGGNITVRQSREAAEMFRALSTRRLKLYHGAAKLLKTLTSSGARVFLLSNAQSAFTMPELEKLGLINYFYGIALSSDFGWKKPSPAFFDYLITKYHLSIGETIYIGNDISCDIVPAAAAGMKTAYILSEISPPGDSVKLASSIAGFATDDFGSLCEYLISEAS